MPHMHWHPSTGESQVFADGEIPPEGWLDHHPADATKAPPPAPPSEEKPTAPSAPLSRKEVIKALEEGGVEFDAKTSTKDLTDLLTDALLGVLGASKVEVKAGASAREMLELVRNVE